MGSLARLGDEAQGEVGGGDFAFQTGAWRVRHRKLKGRLCGQTDWIQFEGVCAAWEILGGMGNVEDQVLEDPSGPYRAAALRRFDTAQQTWSIWWIDSRFAALDPPVVGRFAGGVGTFFGDAELEGRPIKVRFIWSEISASSARWEQAFSGDGGAMWEVNWVMTFERAP